MPSNGSWQKVRFDQICKNISNRIDDPKQAVTDYYVGLEHLDREEPKILRHGSPQDVSKTKLLFKPGHILFAKRNWYLRRLAVAQREGICSAHMLVLEPIEDKITKEFLPLLMFSDDFYEKALMVSAGSMSPTIKWKDIGKLEFLIPPIPEQETILSLTRQIDDSISKTQDLLEKTKIYSISRRESLVTRGIGHTKFKKVKWLYGKTIEIPTNWKYIKLKESGQFSNGINKSKESFGHGCLFVNILDIFREFTVEPKKLKRVQVSETEIRRYGLKKGDLILDRSSNIFEAVGYPCYFDGTSEPVVFSGFTFRYRPDQKIWNSKFLTFQMMSSLIRKTVISFATKSANSNINQESYSEIFIPCPPIIEQQKILIILENLREKLTVQQSHLSKLKIMRKSIINSKLTKEKTNVAN